MNWNSIPLLSQTELWHCQRETNFTRQFQDTAFRALKCIACEIMSFLVISVNSQSKTSPFFYFFIYWKAKIIRTKINRHVIAKLRNQISKQMYKRGTWGKNPKINAMFSCPKEIEQCKFIPFDSNFTTIIYLHHIYKGEKYFSVVIHLHICAQSFTSPIIQDRAKDNRKENVRWSLMNYSTRFYCSKRKKNGTQRIEKKTYPRNAVQLTWSEHHV